MLGSKRPLMRMTVRGWGHPVNHTRAQRWTLAISRIVGNIMIFRKDAQLMAKSMLPANYMAVAGVGNAGS